MSQRLLLADPQAAADVLTFARRAAPLGDGAVRLRAARGILVISDAPLAPRTLLDATPTVLGMRMLRADPELECDLVVPADALTAAADDPVAIVLPELGLAPAWAGIAPPRGGWEQTATVPADVLAATAEAGIAEVARQVPTDAGEDVVRAVRAAVWGRPDERLDDLPRGAAFTAFALGFILGEETAVIRRTAGWARLTLARGHVAVRTAARTGLTEVRATGRG